MQLLQKGRPIDFHTSNIQRAQTKRLVLPIVRLGDPIGRPPEGRSDDGRRNDKTHNGTNCFIRRVSAISRPAPLFSPFFSGKTEKNGPAEQSPHRLVQKNGPSAHPKWACGAILHRMAQKNRKGVSPFRLLSFQKAHGNNGRCRLRSRRRSGCGNRPWPAARPLRRWSYSRSPRS